MIGPPYALTFGLAHRVVSTRQLLDESIEIAKNIALKAPLATKMALLAVKH